MYLREKPVHFFHFDPRACGRRHSWRRVITNDDEVTCPDCLGNVEVEITDQGRAVVKAVTEGRLAEFLEEEVVR